MARPIAVAVLHEIRRDGVEPCRKPLARVEFGAILVNPHEAFLRSVGCVFCVLQAADEVVEQLPRVTLHQVVQRRVVARRELGHVGSVEFIKPCVPVRRLIQVVGFVAHCFTFTEKLTLPFARGPS